MFPSMSDSILIYVASPYGFAPAPEHFSITSSRHSKQMATDFDMLSDFICKVIAE